MDLQVTAAKLTGDPERDVKTLSNHVFQLEEQLRYQLRNLDVTNFNDLGLARYENGRLQIYTEQLEIQTEQLRVEFGKETDDLYTKLEATAKGLQAEIKDQNGQYTTLKATVDGLQTTVSGQAGKLGTLESQITQTNSKISAVVSAVGDSSGNVTAASIVAAINEAGSSVKISADHITLTGVVTVDDLSGNGTVEINAGNIAAGGTISGVSLESTGEYSWRSVIIEDGQVKLYSGGLYDDSFGQIALESSGTLHLKSGDGNVRVYPQGTNYWEFRSDGIYWCNSAGTILNRVVLNGS